MFLNRKQKVTHLQYKNSQKGSALVVAVFIIVVISLLGAALINMLKSGQENVAYEVLGTRAYMAAQSGVQWQLSEVFPLNSGAVSCKSQSVIDNNKPTFNQVDGLTQCNVSVKCSDFVQSGIRYFTIESTGQCDINGEVTARTLEVEARSL